MKKLLGALLLCGLWVGCTSDDVESCETKEPVEVLTGETRFSFTWRDITDGQVVTDYEIQYGSPGFTLGEGALTYTTRVTVSSDPDNRLHIKTLNQLPNDQSYEFYYRSRCGDERGEYIGPLPLRTLKFGEGCTAPTALEVVKVTTTTALLQWEGYDEEVWNIGWGSNDGTVGGDADVFEPMYEITGLEPGLTYLVGVKARCSDTEFVISDLFLNPTVNFSTPEE